MRSRYVEFQSEMTSAEAGLARQQIAAAHGIERRLAGISLE